MLAGRRPGPLDAVAPPHFHSVGLELFPGESQRRSALGAPFRNCLWHSICLLRRLSGVRPHIRPFELDLLDPDPGLTSWAPQIPVCAIRARGRRDEPRPDLKAAAAHRAVTGLSAEHDVTFKTSSLRLPSLVAGGFPMITPLTGGVAISTTHPSGNQQGRTPTVAIPALCGPKLSTARY
jgi:hypothetical protein